MVQFKLFLSSYIKHFDARMLEFKKVQDWIEQFHFNNTFNPKIIMMQFT